MSQFRFAIGVCLAAALSTALPGRAAEKLTLGGVKPAENDVLLNWYADDPDTLNPVIASDVVSEAMHRLVCQPMAQRKFSNPDEWEPLLAESWTFDKEKLEYTIKLRHGVMWQPIKLPNGKELPATEFTAKDVKFTFDCILNPAVKAGSARSYYEDTDPKAKSHYKIKVSLVPGDKYTVKVKWTKPYFLSEEFTIGATYIIPRHVYSVNENGEQISFDFASKEFADGFNDHWANTRLCGTGQMVLKQWTRQQHFVFERNPNYWGAPSYFSRIEYQYNTNHNTVLQKVLSNQWDWAPIPEKDLWLQAKQNPNVIGGKVKLVDYEYPGYRYLGYNEHRDLFKDKRVRQAIGHAIPIEQIIDKIYHGLAVRTTGPFLPGSSGYDSSLKALEYDLDKARALLDDAGWKDSDGDGVRDKRIEGKKVDASFTLMIFSDSPQYQLIAELVKENCQKIGIQVSISPASWALMLQKLKKKEFDATILGWATGWRDDPFQLWDSSQAESPDSSNSIGYANPQVDKLIDELRMTFDKDKQSEIYKKIHRLIYDDQPYTFLFSEKATSAYDARIDNVKFYKIRPCVDAREWTTSAPRLFP